MDPTLAETIENELLAVSSMFPDCKFSKIDDSKNNRKIHLVRITNSNECEDSVKIKLKFWFQAPDGQFVDYPTSEPPFFSVESDELNVNQKTMITSRLSEIYEEINGEILYSWMSYLTSQTLLGEVQYQPQRPKEQNNKANEKEKTKNHIPSASLWIHGQTFTKSKSKFIAHLLKNVPNREFIDEQMEILKNEDKKIANATHNMLAFRIQEENGDILENYDDDGETGAGSGMCKLVSQMKVLNVAVCVTRWFGGIMLGADRFKIINMLTKEIIEQNNCEKEKK